MFWLGHDVGKWILIIVFISTTRGEFDQPQVQNFELRDAPHRAAGVGRGLGAGGAVSRQMRFPRLDMVFGLSTPAVDVLLQDADVAGRQIVDDGARVGFALGLVESFGWGWYIALIFAPTYNIFAARI